jgi:hypothetical protein
VKTARMTAMAVNYRNPKAAHARDNKGGGGSDEDFFPMSARLRARADGDAAGVDEDEIDARAPLIVTSRAGGETRRSHRPKSTAPFDDPRFVRPRAGAPTMQSPPDPRSTPIPPLPLPSHVHVQAPGLSNPAPPPLPPPGLMTMNNGGVERSAANNSDLRFAPMPSARFTPRDSTTTSALPSHPSAPFVQAPGLSQPMPPPMPSQWASPRDLHGTNDLHDQAGYPSINHGKHAPLSALEWGERTPRLIGRESPPQPPGSPERMPKGKSKTDRAERRRTKAQGRSKDSR